MNIEKFTTKFQQALSEAQSLALGKDNQFIEPVHLLAALLNQQDGSIAPILTASGVNVALLRNELNAELNKLPARRACSISVFAASNACLMC